VRSSPHWCIYMSTHITFDDFKRFVEKNADPAATFRYYRSKEGFANTISICDESLPKRATHIETGHAESDWHRDSFVCNVGYYEGFVPIRSTAPVWNETLGKFLRRPVRGAVAAAQQLRAQKCIKDTHSVQDFIKTGVIRE